MRAGALALLCAAPPYALYAIMALTVCMRASCCAGTREHMYMRHLHHLAAISSNSSTKTRAAAADRCRSLWMAANSVALCAISSAS